MAESVTKSPQSYDSPEHEIKRLRMRIAALEDENKRLKETNVKAMSEKEFEEEHITNRLMKRLDEVEAQKAKLTKAVQEEDVMLKDMQERMQKLQEEKAQLESELEKEHTLLVQQKKSMKEKLKERTAELEKRLADAQQTSVEMSSKVAEEEVVVRDLRYKLRKIMEAQEKMGVEFEAADEQRFHALNRRLEKLVKEKQELEQNLEKERIEVINQVQELLENQYRDILSSPGQQSRHMSPLRALEGLDPASASGNEADSEGTPRDDGDKRVPHSARQPHHRLPPKRSVPVATQLQFGGGIRGDLSNSRRKPHGLHGSEGDTGWEASIESGPDSDSAGDVLGTGPAPGAVDTVSKAEFAGPGALASAAMIASQGKPGGSLSGAGAGMESGAQARVVTGTGSSAEIDSALSEPMEGGDVKEGEASDSDTDFALGLLTSLKQQLEELKRQRSSYRKHIAAHRSKTRGLQKEVKRLQSENEHLGKQLQKERTLRMKGISEDVEEEAEAEEDEAEAKTSH